MLNATVKMLLLSSSSSPNEPPCKDDHQRPEHIKHPPRTTRVSAQWIAGEYIFLIMLGRGNAGEFVNRFQHDRFNRRALHDSLPTHLIPNFAVMIFRFFKQSGHTRGRIMNLEPWQNSAQLAEHVLFEISESRIFR